MWFCSVFIIKEENVLEVNMKIECIIFDFDGVIADTEADIAGAVQATQKQWKSQIMMIPEITKFVGHGAAYLIENCLPGLSKEESQRALDWYKEYYLDHCVVDTKLYPNVANTLQWFHDNNGKMAVVSNKPEPLTKLILQKLGVKELFEIIIGPESLKNMKPNPEGIIKAIEFCGAKVENSLMVGDSYTDIEAGKAAGAYTCGVLYGIGNKQKLIESKPDFLIEDMYEIKNNISIC